MPYKNTGIYMVNVVTVPETIDAPRTTLYPQTIVFNDLTKSQARAIVRKVTGLWMAARDAGTNKIEVVEDPSGILVVFQPRLIHSINMEQETIWKDTSDDKPATEEEADTAEA